MKKMNVRQNMEDLIQLSIFEHIRRFVLVVAASIILAININSFVNAGGLIPGGFTGVTLLFQRGAMQYFGLSLPFAPINILFNAVPVAIGFKYIGKRFTTYSCLCIVLVSILTDVLPALEVTEDLLLISVFGGIISGFAVGLCLLARTTSGGSDIIAVALSDKLNVDAWNYILYANAVMLVIAGIMFGWEKALYSILFQFSATQIVKVMDSSFKRSTLFIVSEKTEEIYQGIIKSTNHSATLFRGQGLYNGKECTMLYSVISEPEVRPIMKKIKDADPKAFVNVMKTEQIGGKFYRRPND